jgi:hypothetical protein
LGKDEGKAGGGGSGTGAKGVVGVLLERGEELEGLPKSAIFLSSGLLAWWICRN